MDSEKKAQMCIYNASWETHFGFCCDIDKAASHELSGLPEVLFVRPDRDFESAEKDYSLENVQLGGVWNLSAGTSRLFSEGNSKNWLVRMEKATVEVVTKAQMVDYYTQILSRFWESQSQLLLCPFRWILWLVPMLL
ncbi:organelle RRM domain-containing protein 1, chloroplastic-like isoform X2 [Papaver somniferum]|uniref:organelle RRM domain-containing protein 1, chloroplastic-like isoform X2 n=1 Tax=Papaver somniferum TaxID=3469 RepID=UPI000E6F820B|nr:organelle RRM domain-containing protein 1, chloroplastic-like isoform X2 [Papaver somniferum]